MVRFAALRLATTGYSTAGKAHRPGCSMQRIAAAIHGHSQHVCERSKIRLSKLVHGNLLIN